MEQRVDEFEENGPYTANEFSIIAQEIIASGEQCNENVDFAATMSRILHKFRSNELWVVLCLEQSGTYINCLDSNFVNQHNLLKMNAEQINVVYDILSLWDIEEIYERLFTHIWQEGREKSHDNKLFFAKFIATVSSLNK